MKFLARRITGRSFWADASRRLLNDPVAVWSAAIIFLYVVIAVGVFIGQKFPDLGVGIATNWRTSLGDKNAPPVFGSDWHLWLGLDLFGYSVTAKVLQGTYTALYVGLMSSMVSIPVGVVLGAVAGYFGGWVDDLITWFYTMVSNIPDILLIVAIGFALGKGLNAVIIALGMTTWVSLARLIRGEVMKHKAREYVSAASALGAGHVRRIFVHILPNVMHIIIISFSLRFVTAIKSEVVLTYLGLGAPTGSASWGLMIDEAKGELNQGIWWGLTGATVAMFLIVLAFSLFSDALRDAFDPKLKT